MEKLNSPMFNVAQRKRNELQVAQERIGSLLYELSQAKRRIAELEVCQSTGALHRDVYFDRAARLVERASNVRKDSVSEQYTQNYTGNLALFLIDIDHMHDLNRIYGHVNGGDNALRLLASVVQKHIRPSDLFGRIGGDEFAIMQEIPRALGDGRFNTYKVPYRKAVDIRNALAEQGVSVTISVRYFVADSASSYAVYHKQVDDVLSRGKAIQRGRVYINNAVAVYTVLGGDEDVYSPFGPYTQKPL